MEKIKVLVNKYHYQNSFSFGYVLFFALSLIPSIFYFLIIFIKNFLYKIKLLKEQSVPPYVICVGNLTTGGVGKTPIVCEVANYVANTLKKKTAVISRGYNSKLDNNRVNIIKDTNGTYFDDGTICADEPYLLAKNTKNVTVLVCKDRVKAAKFAKNNYGCEVVILDDGFSNRKIKKDFTILVADSKKMFGNNFLLPLGPLREPVYEAKRADFVVVSNKNNENISCAVEKLSNILKTKHITSCNFVADYLYNIKNTLQVIPQKTNAAAFCAIGQPEQFYDYLNKYFDVVYTKSFPDHHMYSKKDIDQLTQKTLELEANTLVTTQKDEVKIKNLIKNSSGPDFLCLKLKAEFSDKNMFYAIEKGIKNYALK